MTSTRTLDETRRGTSRRGLRRRGPRNRRAPPRRGRDGRYRGRCRFPARCGVDVVLTTGGTGLTPDDVTVDAIEPLFDRPVPGFGELFRWLSYDEVGPMAMASRATAGVVDDRRCSASLAARTPPGRARRNSSRQPSATGLGSSAGNADPHGFGPASATDSYVRGVHARR